MRPRVVGERRGVSAYASTLANLLQRASTIWQESSDPRRIRVLSFPCPHAPENLAPVAASPLMTSPNVMIRLCGLVVQYGAFRAVDELDLELVRGELFGLLGPNGAGKSTTVRVLIGQRRADAGQVTVGGFDVARQWQRVKSLFGYVPDRDNHFDEFTGRRNLQIFADLYGAPRQRVDECLRQVELQEAANLAVRGYALGMKKKLLLARS